MTSINRAPIPQYSTVTLIVLSPHLTTPPLPRPPRTTTLTTPPVTPPFDSAPLKTDTEMLHALYDYSLKEAGSNSTGVGTGRKARRGRRNCDSLNLEVIHSCTITSERTSPYLNVPLYINIY